MLLLCFLSCVSFGEASSLQTQPPVSNIVAGNSGKSCEDDDRGCFLKNVEETEKAVVPVSFLQGSLQISKSVTHHQVSQMVISNSANSANNSEHKHAHNSSAVLNGRELPELYTAQEFAELFEQAVLPIAFGLLMTLLFVPSFEKLHIAWIPESLVVIFIGAFLELLLVAAWGVTISTDRDILHNFSNAVLNSLLLPIIVFEGGWSTRWKDFAHQLPYILIFAILGSITSMFVVAGLIYWTSEQLQHGGISFRTAMAFGSLIAATDPVATLATYSSLKVEPLLNIIVFGESTVNDAVSIVMFDIFNDDYVFGSEVVLADKIILGMVQKLVGSVTVGVVLAGIVSFAHRMIASEHHSLLQVLYILISCYFIFAAAEAVNCSGIVANLFASIIMSIYTKPQLDEKDLDLCNFFVKGMATLADTSIFLLVGVDVLNCTGTSLKFSMYIIAFCIIARFVATVFWGLVANGMKMSHGYATGLPEDRWFLLSWKHLLMIWHAGLRGGIALALVLQLGDWVDKENGPGTAQVLVNATLVVIIVFLLIFGGSTAKCLKALGIPMGQEYPEDYLLKDSELDSLQSCFKVVDERFLSPLLVGSSAERSMSSENVSVPKAPSKSELGIEARRPRRSSLSFYQKPPTADDD